MANESAARLAPSEVGNQDPGHGLSVVSNPFAEAWDREPRAEPLAFDLRSAGYRENVRPTWVSAAPEPSTEPGRGTLILPDGLSPTARLIAEALALEASTRLTHSRDRTEYALTIAAGRDWVVEFLTDVLGVRRHRDTVRDGLLELHKSGVAPRVGQMAGQGIKSGAYVYRLNVVVATADGHVPALVEADSGPSPSNRCIRHMAGRESAGTGRWGRRIQGALMAAIRDARPGDRNHWGHWLACRCADAGLSEAEALAVCLLYRARVAGSSSFRSREVYATVGSLYRRRGKGCPTPKPQPGSVLPIAPADGPGGSASRPTEWTDSDFMAGPARPRTGPTTRQRRRAEWEARRRVPIERRIAVADLTAESAPWRP